MSNTDEADVRATVERLRDATKTGDLETMRSLMMDVPGATHIGTDASEWWSTADYLASASESLDSQDVTTESTELNVHVKGDVAWIEGKGLFKNSAGSKRDTRVTGVLVRDSDGRWKAVQSHASIPVPNDQIFTS